MPTWNYCVSFRIADKTINGKTYAERRQMLVDNVHENMGYWEETTSFFMVESSRNTDQMATKAVKGLSAADDMVLVFDPSDMTACYFGPVLHLEVLRSFFPKLKKVP
jgi:hypothetical protein